MGVLARQPRSIRAAGKRLTNRKLRVYFARRTIHVSRVPEYQAAQRLLLQCFDSEELAYLQEQPVFAQAAAQMKTLTEFEQVAILGQRLLSKRDDAAADAPAQQQTH